MTKLGDGALQAARSQLGQSEEPKGSNRGPMVDRYLAAVGLDPGYAWCAAFVYWCHEQAAAIAGTDNPVPKTGSVMKLYAAGVGNRALTPKSGDIFIMDYGKGTGHTGIVELVNGNGTITTIEGNTNDEGGREGYEVARRTRPLSKIVCFLRY